MKQNISDIATIRQSGTIVMANSVLCDGKNDCGIDDGKNIACYTHIHDDHICGLEDALGRYKSRVYATTITKKLSSALLSYDVEWIKDRENYYGLEYDKPVRDNDLEISFHNANHILGSAQLLVRTNDYSVLYSSDFILDETSIVKDVDYLVLDSTHGRHSEIQQFDDLESSKIKIIDHVKKIFDGNTKQLIIYAARGTMQLIMSWLRKELDNGIIFLANKNDANIARVYGEYGYFCGEIEDNDKFQEYYNFKKPFICFHPRNVSKPEQPIPSIRVGSALTTSIKDNSMSVVNLKEHATASEVYDYVKQINPRHVILDNSHRTSNTENVTYLKDALTKLNFSVLISPKNRLIKSSSY